jgi:DNA gyrase subunit A
LTEYRLTSRGAKGVKTINITDKNGPLVVLKAVNGDEDLLMVTNTGTIIRINLSHVGVYGRDTQGVRMISVDEGGSLSMAAVVESEMQEGSE